MPKKKEKKNGNDNVEFDARQDITDARKVKRFVTEHFKETHRTISRAYRGSKAERVREAFNLVEPYESRRIRAVANSLPQVWRRYGAKYPGLAVENEWAMLCSRPILAYDELDFDHNLCLGAALWMLDTLKDYGQLDQALAPWIARYGEELVQSGFPESWTILRGRLEADVAPWLRLRQGVLIAGAVSGAGVLAWTLVW